MIPTARNSSRMLGPRILCRHGHCLDVNLRAIRTTTRLANMAENVSPATPPTESAPANESPAQRDARLRRMRRNAKIAASGSDRLNKITSMSGRPAAAEAG